MNSPLTKKRALAYLTLILFIVFTLTSQKSFCEQTSLETLITTVYPDGFTFVDLKLEVDKTFPTNNITIFGQVVEDLIILDKNGLPLNYQLNASSLSIHSLGTEEISVTYLTQDLTSKDGRYWTFTLNAPINAQITLPTETAIISLNKVPEIIETKNHQVTLVMSPGESQVTYVIGVIGTQEHAQILMYEAENLVSSIKNLGIILTKAEVKLQDSITAFNLGNYAEAETLANEANDLAIQINQTAIFAISKIDDAENAIKNKENNEETINLTVAKNLLKQAKTEYELGNYSEALYLANQTILEAEQSTVFLSKNNNFPFYGFIAIILIAFAILFSYIVLKKSRKKPETSDKAKRQIDVQRILKEHTDLISEEKQAIIFLAENNGESFEAELYDYVKLPRTTTWRLVKRLKRMGILTVTKFRRQNLVRIKSKYDIKE